MGNSTANTTKSTNEDKRSQESSLNKKDVQLVENLNVSEIRYRRLFESAKDGILILDFEFGSILDANPFIVKIIGLPVNWLIC